MKLKKLKKQISKEKIVKDVEEKSKVVEKPKAEKKPKKEKPEYYVIPKVFQEQILTYYDTNDITDPLATSIYNIANRMSYRPNFVNYSYREEMTGDAVVKMFMALKNKKFDPAKGNPFSYYSKIAFNAFRNRIKKEKKAHEALLEYQSKVYDNLIESGFLPSDNNVEDGDGDGEGGDLSYNDHRGGSNKDETHGD